MRVYVDTEVVKELGATAAFLLEYIFTEAPHYNIDTKLNVSTVSRSLPISLRTCQRLIKDLLRKGYLCKTSDRYSLTRKFFLDFEAYNKLINYE